MSSATQGLRESGKGAEMAVLRPPWDAPVAAELEIHSPSGLGCVYSGPRESTKDKTHNM